jgi:hypothetical protein
VNVADRLSNYDEEFGSKRTPKNWPQEMIVIVDGRKGPESTFSWVFDDGKQDWWHIPKQTDQYLRLCGLIYGYDFDNVQISVQLAKHWIGGGGAAPLPPPPSPPASKKMRRS